MGTDQRRQKRVRLNLPVKMTLLTNDDESHGPVREGILHDLSAGGCAVYHDKEIPIGTRVQVHIRLDEAMSKKFQKSELTARGAICRIQKHVSGEYVLSIRFFK